MSGEFDCIEHVFRPLTRVGANTLRGIGDDCALVTVPMAQALALTSDTLVEGGHFPADAVPFDVGWKALACSLSDLAAVGAEPAWAMLALAVPHDDRAWVQAFASGFGELAGQQGVALVGGDLVASRVRTITVQAGGHVPPGQFIGRDGARPGDAIYVSGWPGEAAAGLALRHATPDPVLLERLHRPVPRVALGTALRRRASACIDISDGLTADLGHILTASGVGACLDHACLPISPRLAALADQRAVLRWILGGGDDYELCFTVAPVDESALLSSGAGAGLTCIGRIEAQRGLRWIGPDGQTRALECSGYDHFRGGDDGC